MELNLDLFSEYYCIENFPEGYWEKHGPCKGIKEMPFHEVLHFNFYSISIPKKIADFETIHRLVSQKLFSTEGLVSIYDACCWRWHTEYSKPHINHKMNFLETMKFVENQMVMMDAAHLAEFMQKTGFSLAYLRSKKIFNKRDTWNHDNVAHECARVAEKKFPHNAIDWNEYYKYNPHSLPIPLMGPRLWGQTKLRYVQDESTFRIEVDALSLSNRSSFTYLFHDLHEALDQTNLVWEPRKSYVSLLEGIQWEKPTHIMKYAMDDMICREICTFLK
jgi:hypothetical protein